MPSFITPALRHLNDAFARHGHEVRLVGGAVRAWLCGEEPRDIDLCTDATPEEQEAIYQAENFRHYPTGIRHGTWTVMLEDRKVVEITSLRTQNEHDTTMIWTRDWEADLLRRDLTINAMAMSFDGDVIDPFGGKSDLDLRLVRFVGDPAHRIREDHLRILRFFRFHAHIAGDQEYDGATMVAIKQHVAGLSGVARERIWREIAQIAVGRYGFATIQNLVSLGVTAFIDMPSKDIRTTRLRPSEFQAVEDPITVMAAYLETAEAARTQASVWRWSAEERGQAVFIADVIAMRPDLTLVEAQRLLTRGVIKHWIIEALCLLNKSADAEALLHWPVPDFPVFGRDLRSAGVKESEEIGTLLRALRRLWEESEYGLNKKALLNLLPSMRRPC